ncbi:signal peptidase I [Corynebacterium sp. ES2715-CONJ3]|uniref:signal peptidase I n=1 Tax=Corynebacterium sp. ES2715-CONJ3 TaxID=2974028 RepID=UPI0037C06661
MLLRFHSVNQHPEYDASGAKDPDDKKPKEKKEKPWYIEIPLVVLLTIIFISILQVFVGRIYLIPSQSMEPTLHGCAGCFGDRIFVEKITYAFDDPQPGDVVVFKGTDSWNTNFVSSRSTNPLISGLQEAGAFIGFVAPDENDLVKRVIATGGQTVQCLPGDSGVMVDGKRTNDSFINTPPQYPISPDTGSDACGGPYFGPVKVPDQHLFMMGDNRTNSADSRYHLGDNTQGTIPVDNVKGKVSFILFPLPRTGFIEHVDLGTN